MAHCCLQCSSIALLATQQGTNWGLPQASHAPATMSAVLHMQQLACRMALMRTSSSRSGRGAPQRRQHLLLRWLVLLQMSSALQGRQQVVPHKQQIFRTHGLCTSQSSLATRSMAF